eukprot:GAFH01002392.1.p1 GENE.GAFH01002392.1~~GAFH01002392.1.p1  ORF type:complete len:360 (-),score=140.60 GAFH01002392.1:107-1150(-)
MPAPTPTEAAVHPVVLLSAVDHFNREGKSRVVGILLGENFRGKVEVTNCFAVPFEENDDGSTWFVDTNYITAMRGMFRKVNASEVIVGWYSTGPKICPNDLAIHQVLRRMCDDPIFVIIDVNPKADEFPTQAYICRMQDSKDGSKLVETFQHIPSEMGAQEAEDIGVEHLLRDVQDSTVTSLHARILQKCSSLRALRTHLQEIQNYLDEVLAKRLPINQNILALLQEVMNLLPNLNVPELRQALASATNDNAAVLVVSHYLRTILALHQLVDNKLTMQHAQQQLAEQLAKKQQEDKERQEKERQEKERQEKEKQEKEKQDKEAATPAAQPGATPAAPQPPPEEKKDK